MSSHHLLLTPVSLRWADPVGEAALIRARVREARERWVTPLVEVPDNAIPGRERQAVSAGEKADIMALLDDGQAIREVSRQMGRDCHTIRRVVVEMRGLT